MTVIKWQDVPKPNVKLKGYKACIEYLASQTKNQKGDDGQSIGGGLRFKCMVVDTKKHPLKKKSVGATDKIPLVIAQSLSQHNVDESAIRWVSPLAVKKYSEYQEQSF